MPKFLLVEASPRGEFSISGNLASRFVASWKTAHHYMNFPWLGARLTPLEKHTPEIAKVLAVSNVLVDELLAADHIVISTPVYNYNIPANLK